MSTSSSPAIVPQFRVFFALQQAVLLEKARSAQNQVFSRFSLPEELRLTGSFSQFVILISRLIKLGLASYPLTAANRLVFVTADYVAEQLTIRITDGGSGFRYQTGHKLGDSSRNYSKTTPQHILAETELLIRSSFRGQFSVRSFSTHGTQVTLRLPVPTGTQTPDTS